MLEEIFGATPQVKVIDYLLAHPFHSYTKQQIAVGSEISRSTLNKFIANLLDLGLIIRTENGKYALNHKSKIVKKLDGIQHTISMEEMEKQVKLDNEPEVSYTDEEIDKMFETNVPDISLDEVEREIELKERKEIKEIKEEKIENKNREKRKITLDEKEYKDLLKSKKRYNDFKKVCIPFLKSEILAEK